MIRGAIAFALVLRIPYCKTLEDEGCISKVNYDILVSSTLILVVITTLLFGNFMGKVQSILVPETPEDEEEYVEMKRKNSAMIDQELTKRRASSVGAVSHYEEITHPNEDRSGSVNEYDPDAPFHWPTSSFVRWFVKYDETTLKPFFIRSYDKIQAMIEDEYQDLIKAKFDDNNHEEDMAQQVDLL